MSYRAPFPIYRGVFLKLLLFTNGDSIYIPRLGRTLKLWTAKFKKN